MKNMDATKVGLMHRAEYSTNMFDMKAGLIPMAESIISMAGMKESQVNKSDRIILNQKNTLLKFRKSVYNNEL